MEEIEFIDPMPYPQEEQSTEMESSSAATRNVDNSSLRPKELASREEAKMDYNSDAYDKFAMSISEKIKSIHEMDGRVALMNSIQNMVDNFCAKYAAAPAENMSQQAVCEPMKAGTAVTEPELLPGKSVMSEEKVEPDEELMLEEEAMPEENKMLKVKMDDEATSTAETVPPGESPVKEGMPMQTKSLQQTQSTPIQQVAINQDRLLAAIHPPVQPTNLPVHIQQLTIDHKSSISGLFALKKKHTRRRRFIRSKNRNRAANFILTEPLDPEPIEPYSTEFIHDLCDEETAVKTPLRKGKSLQKKNRQGTQPSPIHIQQLTIDPIPWPNTSPTLKKKKKRRPKRRRIAHVKAGTLTEDPVAKVSSETLPTEFIETGIKQDVPVGVGESPKPDIGSDSLQIKDDKIKDELPSSSVPKQTKMECSMELPEIPFVNDSIITKMEILEETTN